MMCVPTKFERLREPGEGKAGILRVYAMSTIHGGPAEKGTGDWVPFLEEFNTVMEGGEFSIGCPFSGGPLRWKMCGALP